MAYSGEYPQPLVRTQIIQVPVVSGSVTARLEVHPDPVRISGYENNTTLFTLENSGNTSFTMQLKETDDRTVSGARSNIGAAVTLVPLGERTLSLIPSKKYLEVWGTSGDGRLRMQIASKLRWNVLGFNKDDFGYPRRISEPGGVPTPDLTTPDHTFPGT